MGQKLYSYLLFKFSFWYTLVHITGMRKKQNVWINIYFWIQLLYINNGNILCATQDLILTKKCKIKIKHLKNISKLHTLFSWAK